MNTFRRASIRTYYTSFFLLVIVALGIVIRNHSLTTVPRHGATFDEFAWAWQGINLIQEGIPISWSSQPQYSDREHLIYQGAAFWIVRPYLEHPPVFGLVSGSFALLNGAKDMYDVTLARIRPLSLLLGAVSLLLIFFLVRLHYDSLTALIASLFYAVAPTVVIGSRLVQNENFLIPLWLLSLISLSRFLKTKKTYWRSLAAILAGLAVLAKVPWVVVGVSLVVILVIHKRWKDAGITLGIFGLLGLLYPVYAMILDKELFFSLLSLQLNRYDIHFHGLFSLFTKPLLVDRYYLDGWVLFGWLSIALLLKDWRKHMFLIIPFICYLGMYLWGIPDEPAHGWYRYPFLPFLIASIAVVVREELKHMTLITLLFVLVVGLSLMGNWWTPVFGFSYGVYRLFIGAAALSVLVPLFIERLGKAAPTILGVWIGAIVVLSVFSVWIFVDG